MVASQYYHITPDGTRGLPVDPPDGARFLSLDRQYTDDYKTFHRACFGPGWLDAQRRLVLAIPMMVYSDYFANTYREECVGILETLDRADPLIIDEEARRFLERMRRRVEDVLAEFDA